MSAFTAFLCNNNITNIDTLTKELENDDDYETKYFKKWRVYNCKFCGWIFYSHMKSDFLRCVCCEYKIKYDTFDCSDCRCYVEPDNCVEGNNCNQFLCRGKIIKCNNTIGIYYKDWKDLIKNESYNCYCKKCYLARNLSILISKNKLPTDICVNCYTNNY